MLADLCPGRRSTALQGLYGVCIRCDRLHAAGELDPAVAQVSGVAQCINWVPLKMAARNRMSERVAGMSDDKRLFVLAHADARRRAAHWIEHQAPDGWRIECSPPRRGADINAALHAKLGEIAAAVPWAGKHRSIEVWKRLLVAAWTRVQGEAVELLPALDGHGVDIVFRRTSQMTQAEMRDLLGFVDAWAAENMPDEVQA